MFVKMLMPSILMTHFSFHVAVADKRGKTKLKKRRKLKRLNQKARIQDEPIEI